MIHLPNEYNCSQKSQIPFLDEIIKIKHIYHNYFSLQKLYKKKCKFNFCCNEKINFFSPFISTIYFRARQPCDSRDQAANEKQFGCSGKTIFEKRNCHIRVRFRLPADF